MPLQRSHLQFNPRDGNLYQHHICIYLKRDAVSLKIDMYDQNHEEHGGRGGKSGNMSVKWIIKSAYGKKDSLQAFAWNIGTTCTQRAPWHHFPHYHDEITP